MNEHHQKFQEQACQEYTLPNGLQVCLVNHPKFELASCRILVKTGSEQEGKWMGQGVSHFLEHILIGGKTTKRSKDDYTSTLEELGGVYNAYTTYDHTAYYINSFNRHIPEMLTLLSEWMFESVIDQSEYDAERSVILREIEQSNADIDRRFYQYCQKNFYQDALVSYPILGELNLFKQVKQSDLYSYYKLWYQPQNMVLVVGGNFNFDDIKRHINEAFSKYKMQSIPYHLSPNQSLMSNYREKTVYEDTEQTYHSIRIPTCMVDDDDLIVLEVLEYILGSGGNNVLTLRLVEELALAFSVKVHSVSSKYSKGYLEIVVECDETNIDKINTTIITEFNKLMTFSDEQILEMAKRQKTTEYYLSLTTVEDIVYRYSLAFFMVQV